MSIADDIASQVSKITIESSIFPKIELDQPFQAAATANPVLDLVKPKITLEFSGGVLPPLTMAPYGEPDPNVGGALIVAAAVAIAALKLK